MKFPLSWLTSLVEVSLSAENLSHLLTMAGLEVEDLEQVAPPFTHVVIGHIESVTKHPSADRLHVCQVDVGQDSLRQVVCGAPNVAIGLRIPCAIPGAVLPNGTQINVSKIRGVESFGMLCSAQELGIADESSGILVLPSDAPVGESLRTYLHLDDHLFTLKLTPNRADCLSMIGVAREISAFTASSLRLPTITPVPITSRATRSIKIEADNACPQYCGRVISGVNASAHTPDWMKQRLERSGIRCISALVDVTNYVLLERGQPLHAFDNDLLTGAITARFAVEGEKIKLLNDQVVTLAADVLVIADDQGTQAIAGIMGGKATAVSADTKEIFLESAFFAPEAIAGRGRRYGLATDSSHRFERGTDFAQTNNAIERATQLIVEICGGSPGPVSEVTGRLPERPVVKLRLFRLNKILGITFLAETVENLLARLGLPYSVADYGDDTHFLVTPPTYRFDLEIEEDLIEEVARVYGYDNIPAPSPKGLVAMLPQSETHKLHSSIRQSLVNRGYQEVINFAFVEEMWERDFAANAQAIRLANPISSQLSVMRSTLISGLVANLQTNLRHREPRVRLFEMGRVFRQEGEMDYQQEWKLAFLAAGTAQPEGWGGRDRQVDFFDVKADLESLFAPATLTFTKAMASAFHPGRCAHIFLKDKQIGLIGELHPGWVQKYEIHLPPVLVEIDMASVENRPLPKYQEISRLPSVIRDLAIIVDQKLYFGDMLAALRGVAPPVVRDIQLFDIYTGPSIPEGKKSLAFRIVMQDTERTLQDLDVEPVMQKLVSFLCENFAAQQRI